jgi:hypothetical protein
VHGNDALPLWYRLRSLAAESGLWQVILGTEPSFFEHRYRLEEHREASASGKIDLTTSIEASLKQSPLAWFRHDRAPFTWKDLPSQEEIDAEPSSQLERPEPNWQLALDPYQMETNVFSIPTEPNIFEMDDGPEMRAASNLFIGLFPTKKAWHIPAYLKLEAFNDAPDLLDHLCVWRWWHSQYRAEIVGVAFNIIEGWLARELSDHALQERLFWEEQQYCSELSEDAIRYPAQSWVLYFYWN